MNKLKWFSSGVARGDQAVIIIAELLGELNNNSSSLPLQKILIDYRDELEKKGSSVPYILSRMNIAVSNVTLKNGITLSKSQSNKLDQLAKLSYIYYGY